MPCFSQFARGDIARHSHSSSPLVFSGTAICENLAAILAAALCPSCWIGAEGARGAAAGEIAGDGGVSMERLRATSANVSLGIGPRSTGACREAKPALSCPACPVTSRADSLSPDVRPNWRVSLSLSSSRAFAELRRRNCPRLVEARPGWPQIINNYGFTHALLPKEYSLIPALEKFGWKKLHEDSVCVILSRNF